MSVPKASYESLVEDLIAGKVSHQEVTERVYALNSQPFHEYCRKYANIVKTYRSSSKKNIEDLAVENAETLVHAKTMSVMDTAILHVIRNAIDHGIESPEQRRSAGKPSQGTLQLKAFHEGGQACVHYD